MPRGGVLGKPPDAGIATTNLEPQNRHQQQAPLRVGHSTVVVTNGDGNLKSDQIVGKDGFSPWEHFKWLFKANDARPTKD